MAQINPKVGDIFNNMTKIMDIIQAHQHTHDVIIFPELALTGYPPEDLLFRDDFFQQVENALHMIRDSTKNCHIIVGHPSREGGLCYNAASLFANGARVARYYKQHLPNYDVFDEQRYFSKGPATPCTFMLKNRRFGLCICEDIWHPGPIEDLVDKQVELIFCINASPFDDHKYALRESVLKKHTRLGSNIVYVNQVGGQDELLFDGQSVVMDATGKLCARAPAFTEHLQTITWRDHQLQGTIAPLLTQNALLYQALICGLKDYVEKNGFPGVILGLSGGIDSALTLCIAVDALGAHRVQAVLMPSRFTSTMSTEDALSQAKILNVQHLTLPIEPAYQTLLSTLIPAFNNRPPDVTEENIQARIRGLLLMALSNKNGHMVLSTSNKSETAVGYCTLYGDMAGGFAVLKDVLKTRVYELSVYRNSLSPAIPERVLTRPPSAELAMNQTDQDTLPDYPILDKILKDYMENNVTAETLISHGFDQDLVLNIIRLIKRNEYKRRQAPPGPKITPCAFGKDWRYPLTSGF